MNENEISKIVVDKAFKIHELFGPGLFESVYEELLAYELKKSFLKREKAMCNWIDSLRTLSADGFSRRLVGGK